MHLSLMMSPLAALSSYSPLKNCLLQMYCSKNSPNSPYIQFPARGYDHIEKVILILWVSPIILPSFHSPIPKFLNQMLFRTWLLWFFTWNNSAENKNGLFYLGYHFPWWSSLGVNFPKWNDTFFVKSKTLSFSYDEINYCSNNLLSSHKLSTPNVLLQNSPISP